MNPSHHQLILRGPVKDSRIFLNSVSAYEAISQLYHYDLTILTEGVCLDTEQWLSQPLAFAICQGELQWFHGKVIKFEQNLKYPNHYHLRVAPELWSLKLKTHSRIWQNQSLLQLIELLLADRRHMKLCFSQLKHEYPVQDYYQYQQSDFEFLQYVLADAGVSYYFTHHEDSHELHLNDQSYLEPCPVKLQHLSQKGDGDLVNMRQIVQFQPAYLQGRDYNFASPQFGLQLTVPTPVMPMQHAVGLNALQQNIYPANCVDYAGLEKKLKQRSVAMSVDCCRYQLKTTQLGLQPGMSIQVAEDKQWYLITKVKFQADYCGQQTRQDSTAKFYHNTLQAIATNGYQAKLPSRTLIGHVHHAIVVGERNEAVQAKYNGQIKVRLLWDQNHCAIWARLAQTWAGAGYGAWFLPRSGDKVLVYYLDGLPERAIVFAAEINCENCELELNDFAINATVPNTTQVNALSLRTVNEQCEWRWQAAYDFKLTVAGNAEFAANCINYQLPAGNYCLNSHNDFNLTATKSINLKVGASSLQILPDKIIMASPLITMN